jgi:hypothetical protein
VDWLRASQEQTNPPKSVLTRTPNPGWIVIFFEVCRELGRRRLQAKFSFFLFFFLRIFVASLILAAILYKRLGSVGFLD